MATKIMMPKLSDTMEEGVILKWLRKEGEKIKQGEILVEIESDKADMELEAYDSGTLLKIVVPEGGKSPIGGLIAIIGDPSEDVASLLSSQASPAPGKPTAKTAAPAGELKSVAAIPVAQPSDGKSKASPLARRLAGEHGVELSRIQGTGPQGRVIKRDLEAHLSSGKGTVLSPTALPPVIPGTAEDIPLSPIRKTIAKRMAESKATAPHFYVTIEIDMDPAMTFREQVNNVTDMKLTYTDIIIKATSAALMKNPQVNGSFLGDKMRHYHYTHIGVAVAMDDGLVTPVIRNCEQKRIDRINAELRELAERARLRKLKPEEYSGATFTISNLGMFGIESFAAIVNPPEGAIMAVGTIVEKPVVKNGQIVIGHTMKATLSADHRIIDGALGARFLQDLKKILENPASIVL